MSGSPKEAWAERSREMKQLTQGHTGHRGGEDWGPGLGWRGWRLLSLILKLLLGLGRGCRTDEPCGPVCVAGGGILLSPVHLPFTRVKLVFCLMNLMFLHSPLLSVSVRTVFGGN